MAQLNDRQLDRPSAASRRLRIVAVVLGVWLVLAASFSVYYVLDQQSRARPPQQTVLNQKLAEAEEAVRREPNDIASRIVVAGLYADAGLHVEAAQQYEEALKINERNFPAINGLAYVYAQLGEPEKAQPLLEKIIAESDKVKLTRTSADMAEARLNLGRLYLAQGNVAEARAQAEAAAEIAASNADVLLLAGQALAAAGDQEAAVARYRQALRFVPKFPEVYQAMVDAYEGLGDRPRAAYARAMVIYSRGDYAKAAGELEGLARANPEVAEVHLGLGMAYERQQKANEAVVEYREALRLDPSLDYAQRRLGSLSQE